VEPPPSTYPAHYQDGPLGAGSPAIARSFFRAFPGVRMPGTANTAPPRPRISGRAVLRRRRSASPIPCDGSWGRHSTHFTRRWYQGPDARARPGGGISRCRRCGAGWAPTRTGSSTRAKKRGAGRASPGAGPAWDGAFGAFPRTEGGRSARAAGRHPAGVDSRRAMPTETSILDNKGEQPAAS